MESYKEIKTYYSRDDVESLEQYDKSHQLRFDYLIENLSLNELKEKTIADFGCGSGYILKRLDKSNKLIAVDGFELEDELDRECYNLDVPYSEDFLKKHGEIDIAFCFEAFEHLTNPYNFVYELKKVLKDNGLLYFSVPHEETQHNTFYPGLIYPVSNLIEFFNQMSFECLFRTVHNARFTQNVLVLRNLPWSEVKMRWQKNEQKFEGQPPHVQVNL